MQGSKHQLSAAFSKGTDAEGRDVQISPSRVPIIDPRTSSSPQRGPLPRTSIPMILQPSVPSARATASARASMASTLREENLATVPVPRGKSRVVFETDHPGPSPSASVQPNQREAKGWFSGPFKEGGRVSHTHDTIERMIRR